MPYKIFKIHLGCIFKLTYRLNECYSVMLSPHLLLIVRSISSSNLHHSLRSLVLIVLPHTPHSHLQIVTLYDEHELISCKMIKVVPHRAVLQYDTPLHYLVQALMLKILLCFFIHTAPSCFSRIAFSTSMLTRAHKLIDFTLPYLSID